MKKDSIKSLLAATQVEMAMLLGVSRGQYSMFESGKRDLPVAAKQVLAEMLAHRSAQMSQTKKPTKAEVSQQRSKRREQLKRLQSENNFQLQVIDRKIAAAFQKQQESANRKVLVDFMNSTAQKGAEDGKAWLIKGQSFKNRYRDADDELLALEVRREVLEFEREVLGRKLGEG